MNNLKKNRVCGTYAPTFVSFSCCLMAREYTGYLESMHQYELNELWHVTIPTTSALQNFELITEWTWTTSRIGYFSAASYVCSKTQGHMKCHIHPQKHTLMMNFS